MQISYNFWNTKFLKHKIVYRWRAVDHEQVGGLGPSILVVPFHHQSFWLIKSIKSIIKSIVLI